MSHTEAISAPGDVRATVPFARLPWIRPLVSAYATDFRSVASLFPGNPTDPASWSAAVTRVQTAKRPHRDIATVLERQLASRQAPARAAEAAALLAAPETVAIVTGQQAGVFGGPLYTLLKALSTIRLARHVASTTGAPVVPVFWVDCEDHDWAEVRTAPILDREAGVATVALDDLPGAGTLPVGRLVLDERATLAIAQLAERLPATEYTAPLRDALERCYTPGTTLTRAFARLLDELLGGEGLVVFEADDPAAKPLVSGIFQRELSHPCEAASLARAGGERMAGAGHAPQIIPTEDTVSLFYLDDKARRPLRYRGGQFYIGDESRPMEALTAEAASHPERFSPNVLLRPLVQDALFPTVAYVAGPSELAYQVQLAELYAAHGLERPMLVSRASATLVDSAVLKFLERSGMPLEALQPQDESALNRLLEGQLPPQLEASCAEIDGFIVAHADRLRSVATSVDPTLSGAVDTTVDRLRDTVKTLQAKIVQAAKKKDETLRRQFMRTRALTFPEGHPQERHLNVSFFLNRYGLDLPSRLLNAVPPVPDSHLVIAP